MKRRLYTEPDDALRLRFRLARARRRLTILLGFALLLLGYASLAIAPDTAQDWVLLRVAAGFGLLFIGFSVAVVPWLAHVFGDSDD